MKAAGLSRARGVVITYPDAHSAERVIRLVRQARETIPIVVRVADDTDVAPSRPQGPRVIPEVLEGSLMIAAEALVQFGVPVEKAMASVRAVRAERYSPARFLSGVAGAKPPEKIGGPLANSSGGCIDNISIKLEIWKRSEGSSNSQRWRRKRGWLSGACLSKPGRRAVRSVRSAKRSGATRDAVLPPEDAGQRWPCGDPAGRPLHSLLRRFQCHARARRFPFRKLLRRCRLLTRGTTQTKTRLSNPLT